MYILIISHIYCTCLTLQIIYFEYVNTRSCLHGRIRPSQFSLHFFLRHIQITLFYILDNYLHVKIMYFCRVCVGQASSALLPRNMFIKSIELTFNCLTSHHYGVFVIQTPLLYGKAWNSKLQLTLLHMILAHITVI